GADLPRAAATMGITLAGRTVGRGLHVVVMILLARALGPRSFGAYAIGWAVVRLGAYLPTLRTDQGLMRFGALLWPEHPGALRRLLGAGLGVALVGGTVCGAALLALAPWLGRAVFGDAAVGAVLGEFALGLPFIAGLIAGAGALRIGTRGAQATL